MKLDVVALFLCLAQVERTTAGNKQRTEFQLTIHTEVLDGQMVLPIISHRLVEGRILFIGDIATFPHPHRLVRFELLPLMGDLLFGQHQQRRESYRWQFPLQHTLQ